MNLEIYVMFQLLSFLFLILAMKPKKKDEPRQIFFGWFAFLMFFVMAIISPGIQTSHCGVIGGALECVDHFVYYTYLPIINWLFAVMAMIQPTVAGYDILFLTKISIYAVVPALNGGFLLFLRGTEIEM